MDSECIYLCIDLTGYLSIAGQPPDNLPKL